MLHSRAAAMPPRSRSLWLTLLLGMLVGLASLGTDSYLPALPVIAQAFDAPPAAVQSTLTSFFIGLAVGQLFWGALSDHFGRKPVLLAALTLYFGTAIAATAATSVSEITWLRLVQGLGMSSGPVVARSVVRDLYTHEHAAQLLARITMVFSIVPIASPVIGAQVVAWWGWRGVFGFLAAAAVPLLVAVASGLRETAPAARSAVNLHAIAHNFTAIFRNQRFRAPFATMLCAQGGIFAFVSSSAFVLTLGAGVSPRTFGVLFAAVMLGQIAGAWASSRLVMQLGTGRMLRLGARLACVAGCAAAALAWAGATHWLATVLPFMAYLFATALLIPSATALALTPFSRGAGAAAAVIGSSQFALGAILSALLGALFDGTPRAMATTVALAGLGALAAEALLVRPLLQPGRTL